jgi:hypothetical protein
MNIYEKINLARIKFQSLNIKMGGNNTFAKYSYFELADILPNMNAICAEVGLCNIISFTAADAIMTIVNTENPEENIIITSPMSTADLKGCHEVQNLGAVQTYLRRYLYQTAYEIIESDALNKTQNPNEPIDKKPNPKPVVDEAELRTRAKELLEKSKMPEEVKAKWRDRLPTLSMKAIDGLFFQFKQEGLIL